METKHKVYYEDARDISDYVDKEIDLVVTSPPYPMVSMWDETFASMNEEIRDELENSNGNKAFNLMHEELDKVWSGISDLMSEGSLVCINVGDATMNAGDGFRLYPNRDRIVTWFIENGFSLLPSFIWRKISTGGAVKGSRTLPTNTYATHDHEHILVFRKGKECREFEPKLDKRYESAYFTHEREKWFNDLWKITGDKQSIDISGRDRSGSYPLEIPGRLIKMFSIYGDNVLDPFVGTGTTMLAGGINARNTIGFEIDTSLQDVIDRTLRESKRISSEQNYNRVVNHIRIATENGFDVDSKYHNFNVKTKQARKIKLYSVKEINVDDKGNYIFNYNKYNHDSPLQNTEGQKELGDDFDNR